MPDFFKSRKLAFATLSSLLLYLGALTTGSNFSAYSLALVGLFTAYSGANVVASHPSFQADKPVDTAPTDGSSK